MSPCIFNLHAEYIMQNAVLYEPQTGIKILRRNINNIHRWLHPYARKQRTKSFLMKVKKESEKVGLKLDIQKIKVMASGPITSWKTDGETMETVIDFSLGLQNHFRW